jgi:hypothetical protein
VEAHSLPPTAAAKDHSLRVYHQVQEWKGEAEAEPLNPEDWGWKLKGGHLMPILTDLPPAPKELLEMIRCGCKTGCITAKCTCRKHGLECTSLCGECRGTACTNAQQPDLDDSTDD